MIAFVDDVRQLRTDAQCSMAVGAMRWLLQLRVVISREGFFATDPRYPKDASAIHRQHRIPSLRAQIQLNRVTTPSVAAKVIADL